MGLFDYQAEKEQNPYYSNFENSPQYKFQEAQRKKSAAIGSVIGTIFSTAASFIPGVGGLAAGALSKGIKGWTSGGTGYNGAEKNAYNTWQHSTPEGTMGSMPKTAASNPPDLSPLESLGKALKFKAPSIGSTDNSYKNAPAVDNIEMAPTDKPILNENAPGVSGTNLEINPTTGNINWADFGTGFKGGGAFEITDNGVFLKKLKKGGSVMLSGGQGNDDLAVVDTSTGNDTGVRLTKGEMVVVSEDNVAALNKALKKGDHKGVFNIMKAQVEKSGEGGGYKEGGVIPEGAKSRLKEQYSDAFYKRGKWKYINGDGKEDNVPEEWQVKLSEAYNFRPEQINMNPPSVLKHRTLEEIDADLGKAKSIPEIEKLKKERLHAELGVGPILSGDTSGEPATSIPATAKTITPTTPADVTNPVTAPVAPFAPVRPATVEQPAYMSDPSWNKNVDPMSLYSYPNQQPQLSTLPADAQTTLPANTDNGRGGIGLGSLLGYAGGAAQLGFGLKAAGQTLPTFSKPAPWNDYLGRLKSLSEIGLTAPEMARLQLNSDRTYAADVNNIYNLSNGNSGAALGNLGRAAFTKNLNDLNIASVDDQARTRNLANYGGYLGQDVNLDRLIFTDNYNNALKNKEAGANLAGAGLKNIMGQAQEDRFYGPNSAYARYMDLVNQKTAKENQMKDAYLAHIKDKGFTPYYGPDYNFGDDGTLDFGGAKYKRV